MTEKIFCNVQVKKRRNRVYPVFLLFFLFLYFHFLSSPCSGEEKTLAVVNKRIITLEDLDAVIKTLPPKKQEHYKQPAAKREFLEDIIRTMVLADEARRLSLAKRREIRMETELRVDAVLSKFLVKEKFPNAPNIPENDIKEYYEKNKAQFLVPEKANIRYIFIKGTGDGSIAKAKSALRRVKAGEDFIKLVREYSEDKATREKGGELGYLPVDKLITEVEKTVHELKIGEVSDIIRTSANLYIVKLEDKQEKAQLPYDQVKDSIRASMAENANQKAVEGYIAELQKKAEVKVNWDMLDKASN